MYHKNFICVRIYTQIFLFYAGINDNHNQPLPVSGTAAVLRGELSTRVPADGRTQYAGQHLAMPFS
jgi:hypothetical protein